MKTSEKLAKALSEAGAPRQMIQRAIDGHYDDYLSSSATPIMDLVRDATAAGLSGIAERAKVGEFDATSEESDAWAESPEGRQTFKDLVDGR